MLDIVYILAWVLAAWVPTYRQTQLRTSDLSTLFCQVLTPDFIDSKSIGGVIEIVAVVESNLKMESHKLLASIVVISSLSRLFPHAANVSIRL